jgi:hypothetical protein
MKDLEQMALIAVRTETARAGAEADAQVITT